jgi:hypothetical protein
MYGISVKNCNANIHKYSYSVSILFWPVNGSRQDAKKRREKHITSPLARCRTVKWSSVESKETKSVNE